MTMYIQASRLLKKTKYIVVDESATRRNNLAPMIPSQCSLKITYFYYCCWAPRCYMHSRSKYLFLPSSLH